MTDAAYGITKNLGKTDFDSAISRVTEALKSEGFGLITEIDVKATFKKKIDVDFRNYKILGACNPLIAHRALSRELMLGLMLPCNVIVFQEDDGAVTVSIADPAEIFKIVEQPGMETVMDQVREVLLRAHAAL